jgi:RNA polymerase sigma factor (TIGR02999 family)
MEADPKGEVTRLLGEVAGGNDEAKEQLIAVVYDELRALAGGFMRRERAGHTLEPTALVHEALVRLLDEPALKEGRNRAYFFGAMAQAMRRVLVEHARARGAQRRGGDLQRVGLDHAVEHVEKNHNVNLLSLDDALEELRALDPRQAEIVVLRFFGGFEMTEIAGQLDVSLSTVEKDWRMARAWLRQQLGEAS